MPQRPNYIILGRIGAPYGIKGYNHIQSYSEPTNQILSYAQWMLRQNKNKEPKLWLLETGKAHAKGLVAKLQGIDDREAAQQLTGCEILILREQLPKLEEGQYYWQDLEGLDVETLSGVYLGKVAYLYPNAGHTNMVVIDLEHTKRERHIPFIEPDFVTSISLESQKIIVDWDPDL